MTTSRLLATAAATALLSGAALAQTTDMSLDAPVEPIVQRVAPFQSVNPVILPAEIVPPGMVAPGPELPPSASMLGTDTAGVVPMSSQSPEVQATLKAGDPNVVSNAPIADTPANRALFGKPLSNAGKGSAPRGN
ncbi:hypothetical protein [Caulobacter henricii]|uniref:Uncharacterized protein n=1 Tax=Caulobacter henricii TaxID=69395 RepID=A0A0P0NZB1_9CAUL|nr:hypothetical protein [Caulobacter henricii]ALL13536.1 hypothetical protein AQ619_09330 [Caulobacter henricii]